MEFGGRALSEGVWAGFRPIVLEGVSEGVSQGRGGALGGGVGWGLGSAWQQGGSEGRGLGLGAQPAPRCLSGQGKPWSCSLPFLRAPPPPSPPGSPRPHWTPNCGWGPLVVGTPPLRQPPLRGVGPEGPAFTFAPPSLPPTPSGPAWLEGASMGRGSGPGSQQVPGDPSEQGKPGQAPFRSSVLLMVPNLPLRAWDPFSSLSHPSGAPVPFRLHFSSPFTPPMPHVLPGHGGSSHPLRCPRSPTGAW